MPTFKWFEQIKKEQAKAARKVAPPPLGFDLDSMPRPPLTKRLQGMLVSLLVRPFLWLLQTFWPVLKLGRLVIVTRYDNVEAVLKDAEHFEVPYGPEMVELAGGYPFVLGLEDTDHIAQRKLLLSVIEKSDPDRVGRTAGAAARRLIEASLGRIDVMKDLITRAGTEACAEYFGLHLDDPDAFAEGTMAISALLFADPQGDADTRLLALHGAARVRQAIDASRHPRIGAPRPDTLLGRLAALDPAPSDAEVRAILVGLATGFVPTTTLAAGKMIEELLKRPAAMRLAQDAARNKDRDRLQKILLEAARLNPALFPGQFRYARKAGVIAGGPFGPVKVGEKSVLLVATAAALRDPRRFPAPGRFDPDRQGWPDVMFGAGTHDCLGRNLAMSVITEIFMHFLALPDLRPVDGVTATITTAGPFPRRLDFDFGAGGDAPLQSMVTVCIPIRDSFVGPLRELLASYHSPARREPAAAFEASGITHFASMSVVGLGEDDKRDQTLLIELNLDGAPAQALAGLTGEAASTIEDAVRLADGAYKGPLAAYLAERALDLRARPWGCTGLNFNGTREFSVREIDQQARLADVTRRALDQYLRSHAFLGSRPMSAVSFVRLLLREPERFEVAAKGDAEFTQLIAHAEGLAELLILPSRRQLEITQWKPASKWQIVGRFLVSQDGLPWLALALAAMGLYFWATSVALQWTWLHGAGTFILSMIGASVGTATTALIIAASFLWLLHRAEASEPTDERYPEPAALRANIAQENPPGHVQNHFTAVTPLKPGLFRRLTLAYALWAVKQLVTYFFRPGFVVNMGTIHYAKWFRPPGSKKLVFLANYDGSWESYLEDFIMKAHQGQSAVWSNGIGFPKTDLLFGAGARDGDRFKRWVRRQQVPTAFWYSRFPQLTTDLIRKNALIHFGLARAATDSAARAWLDCFGSTERPGVSIESHEVQALVFRGMRRLPYSTCALLQFPQDGAGVGDWLEVLVGMSQSAADQHLTIAFGDHPIGDEAGSGASFVAFSAEGLRKLRVPEGDDTEAMGTFSSAFTFGMGARARILGDHSDQDPIRWRWSDAPAKDGGPPVADAALLVYGDKPSRCRELLSGHLKKLGGVTVVDKVETKPTRHGLDFEHFGFRDGVSQPVIRGTERFAKGAAPEDIVEPGEFILGYPNNQGYYPPSPVVPAGTDGGNDLPTAASETPAPYPAFLSSADRHDFGRNGAYLVIRQIRQEVDGFETFTQDKAVELIGRYPNLQRAVGGRISKEWLAAKLLGRWRDGTPLIDKPADVATTRVHAAAAQPSNDFAFGRDDPQGLSCPLGAHIRRANPRDSLDPADPDGRAVVNRHRLLRRGRTYERRASGQPAEKGLLFISVCGDLERQFEFVQQTWMRSPVFHGLTGEADPLLGPGDPELTPRGGAFTIPSPAGPLVVGGMQSFTEVRAGGYFFLPSRAALKYLARRVDTAPSPPRPLRADRSTRVVDTVGSVD